jgi:sugar/nucleoside kinase (ribokinase family)
MERRGIICGIAWCVDHIITIDRWPKEETLAEMLNRKPFGGCPGHNMATALKRLGAEFPVEAIGLIGDDDEGALLASACDEFGIERDLLKVAAGRRTPQTLVMTSAETGRRTFFYEKGTHAIETPDDFDLSLTRARIAHFGLPGLHDVLDRPWKGDASGWVTLVKRAEALGIKCNLELASIDAEVLRHVALPLIPHLNSLIINDLEAGALAGMTTFRDGGTDIDACQHAAAKLMNGSGLDFVAVHFPMGAILLSRDGEALHQPSVSAPQSAIMGSNGAGDAFAAGLLFGYHEGWAMTQSLKLAHASAAASLRSGATTESIVHWKECLALANSWGWR